MLLTISDLKSSLLNDNNGGFKSREKNFVKNLPENYQEIQKFHKNNFTDSNNFTWKQKLFNYLNNIISVPKCQKNGCDNLVKFFIDKNKYYNCCSQKCNNIITANKTSTKTKRKLTNFEKYGAEHPMKSEKIKEKIKKTNLERYGVRSTLLNPETKLKIDETNLKKFNNLVPMKTKTVKDKLNQTNKKKYGKIRYILTEKHLENNKLKNDNALINIFRKKLNINKSQISLLDDRDTLKILNYCLNHSEFLISKNNLRNRLFYRVNICTECYPINNHISIGEDEIRKFIENELKIKTEKIKINNKEIDIYIPDKKIGIEYNGLYWHNEKFKNKTYHQNKTNNCEKNGIKLIQIFEDEWIFKKEIVKNIIKQKLNLITNKISAKDCEIIEINTLQATKFLNYNNIQGPTKSTLNLGLFYQNELVSLMSLNKKESKLLRFSNKLNFEITDAANKLLSFFIENYKPKIITTLVDRRYSNGEEYLRLGFQFKENSEPNYWYFDLNNLKKFNRIKKDSKNKKLLKIFDCGNIKFEIIITKEISNNQQLNLDISYIL